MKKLLAFLFSLIIISGIQNQVSADAIDRTIAQSDINKSGVSVSVRDIETGERVYELHGEKPVMPASTLKLITLSASIDQLGKDYEFSTGLYKNTNNELYLKLGADPFLTSAGLNSLFEKAV